MTQVQPNKLSSLALIQCTLKLYSHLRIYLKGMASLPHTIGACHGCLLWWAIFFCLSKFVRLYYQPETNWRSQASMMVVGCSSWRISGMPNLNDNSSIGRRSHCSWPLWFCHEGRPVCDPGGWKGGPMGKSFVMCPLADLTCWKRWRVGSGSYFS